MTMTLSQDDISSSDNIVWRARHRYAWDEDPPGDTITGSLRLLAGAKVVASQDTGIGHLASLLNAPQVVIYPQRGDERRALVLRDGLRVPMRFDDMHRWNSSLCLPAWGSPEQVLAIIAEALSARVLPGPIDPWKARPVTEVPGRQPVEVVVIREPDRSLILRPAGNDLIETAPLADRPPQLSTADITARIATCQACPDYHAATDRCQRCNCTAMLAQRTRTRFARCPAGRWPADHLAVDGWTVGKAAEPQPQQPNSPQPSSRARSAR
ncbi:MAG: hypothetical protein EA402_09615 [Planctomycetota bacterium]|nr:MAG: hypothetical protein EA402_09615 [Planctomycetota bacterium]